MGGWVGGRWVGRKGTGERGKEEVRGSKAIEDTRRLLASEWLRGFEAVGRVVVKESTQAAGCAALPPPPHGEGKGRSAARRASLCPFVGRFRSDSFCRRAFSLTPSQSGTCMEAAAVVGNEM